MNSSALRSMVARSLRISAADISEDTLVKDLVEDSFALIEFVIELQEELGVRLSQADLAEIVTIADLAAALTRRAA